MDRSDKELIANILTAISIALMMGLLTTGFMTWTINWMGVRGFLLGAVLYLIAYYIHKKLDN